MSIYSEQAGRDPVYQEMKKEFKRKYSRCKVCRKHIAFHDRTVDHIIPMWQYNGSPYNHSNWQMLCKECHSVKTRIDGVPKI